MSAVGAALRGIGFLIALFGALIALFGVLLVVSPEEVGFDVRWFESGGGGVVTQWLSFLGPHAFWIVGLVIFLFGIGFSRFNPLRSAEAASSDRADSQDERADTRRS